MGDAGGTWRDRFPTARGRLCQAPQVAGQSPSMHVGMSYHSGPPISTHGGAFCWFLYGTPAKSADFFRQGSIVGGQRPVRLMLGNVACERLGVLWTDLLCSLHPIW